MPHTAQKTGSADQTATGNVNFKFDNTPQEPANTFAYLDAVPNQDTLCAPNAMRHFIAREQREQVVAWSVKIDKLKARLLTVGTLLEESNERLGCLEKMCDNLEQKMDGRRLTIEPSESEKRHLKVDEMETE